VVGVVVGVVATEVVRVVVVVELKSKFV